MTINRYNLTVLILLLCVCSPTGTSARSEFILGGTDGNAWTTALDSEGSVYLVVDQQNVREVSVGTTPHGAGGDTLIEFQHADYPNSILPRFFDPTVNITLADTESKEIASIPFLYAGGFATTTDGCAVAGQHTPVTKPMFDGDVNTAQFRRVNLATSIFSGGRVDAPLTGSVWPGGTVIDFGAAVPINRIRFYPRLGATDDALLISELAEPHAPAEAFGEDSFIANYVDSYEIRVADNSVRIAASSCDIVGFSNGLRWLSTRDRRLDVLRFSEENLDVVVDLNMPTRSVRWLTFKTFPLRNWEVAEFEVYGEGFVETTSYRTEILDFDSEVNWGKVRWSGDLPEGTRIQIRSRMGNVPDPNLYFEETISGDVLPITLAQWEKIEPSARLDPRPNVENWSFWSPPYDFEDGLRDLNVAAESWEDGTALLSIGPSRYIQLDIRLFSTFTRAPRLDQVWLQFSETPLARAVVGEIWPIEVDSFLPTSFTYVVRPEFESGNAGFDRLEILTHSQVAQISSASIDGEPLDLSEFVPDIQTDRFILSFPELQGEGDSFKQLEVSFEVPVLRYGTEFRSWVFSSQDPDQIRQQVGAGNATFRYSGNVVSVATPLQGDLLFDLETSSPAISPNGDGINDDLTVNYKLRQLTLARPVTLRIYDLAGRLIRDVEPESSESGVFAQRWDGRDNNGDLVTPGTYIYDVTLSAETEERRTGVVGVVY
jgi:hypothetical protein